MGANHVKETSELLAMGADAVIPEEFETSIQIFTQVLQNFMVPEDDIEELVEEVRGDNYQLFKGEVKLPKSYRPRNIADFNITCLKMISDSNEFLGKPIQDLNLKETYGIQILVIKRQDEILDRIPPEETLRQGDELYVLGKQRNIEKFHKLIK